MSFLYIVFELRLLVKGTTTKRILRNETQSTSYVLNNSHLSLLNCTNFGLQKKTEVGTCRCYLNARKIIAEFQGRTSFFRQVEEIAVLHPAD